MENQNNNKGVIVLLIILVIILSVLCVLFATGTISFKNTEVDNNIIDNNQNDNEVDSNIQDNVTDNNQNNNESREHTEEVKGLELYKLMTGNGVTPFVWENEKVINYEQILSRMTESYRKSFENSDHGFSIPFYEDGVWKNSGGWGTAYDSTFKDIKVISINNCTINYEVTYLYRLMSDINAQFQEGKSNFVVKKCADNSDSNEDYSTGYKVESFDLIYGLKFN